MVIGLENNWVNEEGIQAIASPRMFAGSDFLCSWKLLSLSVPGKASGYLSAVAPSASDIELLPLALQTDFPLLF